MTDLSPAAKAILETVNAAPHCGSGRIKAAAALRAAADQVVPVTPKPNDTFCCPPVDTTVWRRVAEIRRQFLAIAAELEATTP